MGKARNSGTTLPPDPLGLAPHAYWRALGMARCVGVPLTRAMADGRLTRRDLAMLVARCQGCGHTDACAAWLADPRHAEPPAFCAIGADILSIGLPPAPPGRSPANR